MPNLTPKLHLPLYSGTEHVSASTFNKPIIAMDDLILGIDHLKSNAHWSLWEENKAYEKNDVVRTQALKSNQVMICIKTGTSGNTEPTNNVTGSKINDGTTQWMIQTISFEKADGGITVWLGGEPYKKGDAVIYGTSLYIAKRENESTEFKKSEWLEIYSSVRLWKPNILYLENDTAVYKGILYRCIEEHTSGATFSQTEESKWEVLSGSGTIKDWEANKTYQLGELVLIDGIIYRANVKHKSQTNPDMAKWSIISANVLIWTAQTYYPENTVVLHENIFYKCNTTHKSANDFEVAKWDILSNTRTKIEDWVAGTSYEKLDVVRHKNLLYRCFTPNNDNTFMIGKWELITNEITDWRVGEFYHLGQYVLTNGRLYQCIHENQDILWTPSHWLLVNRIPTIYDWEENTLYRKQDIVSFYGKIYRANKDNPNKTFFDRNNDWEELSNRGIESWKAVVAGASDILLLCHFDDSGVRNEYGPPMLANEGWPSNGGAKFGYGTATTLTGNNRDVRTPIFQMEDNTDYTIDFWYWYEAHDWGSTIYVINGLSYMYKNVDLYNSSTYVVLGSKSLKFNQWHSVYRHLAYVFSKTHAKLYVDGKLVLEDDLATPMTQIQFRSDRVKDSKGAYIDELRIMKGAAWTGEFTPPTEAYPSVRTQPYKVDDFVEYKGKIYKCIQENSDAVFNIEHWKLLTSNSAIQEYANGELYQTGQVMKYEGVVYEVLQQFTSTGDIFNEIVAGNIKPSGWIGTWETNKHYPQGCKMIVNHRVYQAKENHVSTVFDNEKDKWELVVGTDESLSVELATEADINNMFGG